MVGERFLEPWPDPPEPGDRTMTEQPAIFGPFVYQASASLAELDAMFAEDAPAECRVSPETLRTLRKARDGDGEYLWQAGVEVGEPDRFLGVPIVEDATMEPGAFEFRCWSGSVVARGEVKDRSQG